MDILNVLKCRLEIVDDSVSLSELIERVGGEIPRENSLLLIELDNVIKRHLEWVRCLPKVRPFYTVQPDDDIRILGVAVLLGCGFICSSKLEALKVLEIGADPRWIFLRHVNSSELLRFARQRMIKIICSTTDELRSVHQNFPKARIILQFSKFIVADHKNVSTCCDAQFRELLGLSKELNLRIIGVRLSDEKQSSKVTLKSQELFSLASAFNYRMKYVFLTNKTPLKRNCSLQTWINTLSKSVADYTVDQNATLLAETGQLFGTAACTELTAIVGKRLFWKRDQPSQIDRIYYYLNGGLASNIQPFVNQPVIWKSPAECDSFITSSIFAPSDGKEDVCVVKDWPLPELSQADILVFEDQSTMNLRERYLNPIRLVYIRRSMWSFLQYVSQAKNPGQFMILASHVRKSNHIENLQYNVIQTM